MIYAACTHIQLLQLCCRDTDCGPDDEWDWELIEVKSDHFFGWVMLSSDPFSGAVSFPATQLYQHDWGRGPGEEMSGGGRIAMGEEGGEGHFSWCCCQKKCSLNDSLVACPAKSRGNPQCQGQNPAFQPNVLWSDLFISQCSWQLFGTAKCSGKAWSSGCWKGKSLVLDGRYPKLRASSSKKVIGRTWSPV